MPKTWRVLPRKSPDLITQLLYNRGLKTKQQITEFFDPKLGKYAKELTIPSTTKALARIERAIKKGELIIVYGDYDVDGICASAILYKALTSLGAKVLPYIPHREKEGYGLSKAGLEFARDSGASVVVTVDNGIVAFESAQFAKEVGLDLVITDHHLPLEPTQGLRPTLPEAYAIVHSIKMCGAGVAWCLIKGVVEKDLAANLLQFVAIATIADLIPLTGLNRAFVIEGLKELNATDNLGLRCLTQEAGLEGSSIGSYEVGHIIAPRLNAIGRLEHAIDALRLLCTKDPTKARRLARLLTDANDKRQQLTSLAVEQAETLIQGNGDKKIHILESKDWQPGIIGLVAARVCETYLRPAIAISVGQIHSKGSARSVDGVNIVEVIRRCSDLLIDVGGHSGAAGFTIPNDNLDQFKERLEQLMEKLPDQVEQVLEIEAQLPSAQLDRKLVEQLQSFEPFGMGNPRPLLASQAMRLSDVRTVGEGKHLKGKADGLEFIAFGMGQLQDLLQSGQLVDLAYFLEINRFNSQEIVQLKIKDLKLS